MKDDDLIPYPEKKGVRVNRKYPRLYSDIIPIEDKEYLRVGLSDVVYCGTGQVRKEKHGVSIVTYVNPKDYEDQGFKEEVEKTLKDVSDQVKAVQFVTLKGIQNHIISYPFKKRFLAVIYL